ncbi:MAG: tripartite tricarboxylate transporter TctB family protein [Bacillota bacterium]
MNLAEKTACAALLATGAILVGLSLSLSYMSEGVPGPGFAPLWYGLTLLASSAALAIGVWRAGAGRPERPLVEGEEARHRVLKYIAGTVAAVALVPWIGLLPALMAFLTYFTRSEGKAPWPRAVLLGAGVPVLFWLAFGVLLGVDFPWGVFGS